MVQKKFVERDWKGLIPFKRDNEADEVKVASFLKVPTTISWEEVTATNDPRHPATGGGCRLRLVGVPPLTASPSLPRE